MRTNHSTIDAAVQELDLVADTLADSTKYPHWELRRRGTGLATVHVYLPHRYASCTQTVAFTNFCTVEGHGATLLDALNAALDKLKDIPIGHSVLDVLAVEVAL